VRTSKWAWALAWATMLGLLAAGQCATEDPDSGDTHHTDGSDPDGSNNSGSDGDGWHPVVAMTVYVVDEPATAVEFRELPEALVYLCDHLPDGEVGEVVIRTDRALLVETLAFECPVTIRSDSGAKPTIVGPGTMPLVVNASGGLGLAGLTVTNLAGIQMNTSDGHLLLENNVIIDDLAINIGALTTTAKSARRQRDEGSANWSILSNQLGKGLKLNLGTELGASSKCTVSNNDGPSCTLSGSGSIAGELTYKGNLFNVLDINTKLKASAGLTVSDHTSLNALRLDLQNSDTPKVTLSNNVTASAKLSLLGQASATLTLSSNKIEDGEIKFGVSNLEIKALGTAWGRLAVLATAAVASPALHYSELDSKIKGDFSFTALEAGTENAKVTVDFSNVDAQSNFKVDVKCQTKFTLAGDTVIRGSASIKVDGNIYELEEAKVRWDAGVVFETTGFNAGIKVTSRAGTYKDRFNVWTQPTTTLTIELTDAIFQGGALGIGKTGRPQPNGKSIREAQAAGGDSVTLRNVEWTEPTMALGILDVDGPVTVENCRIATTMQAFSLAYIKGPIRISGNNIQARLALLECTDTATIEDNTFSSNGGIGPDVWLAGTRGLVQNNVMPNGLLVASPNGYALARLNQIGGYVTVGSGALLRLEDNTLNGVQLNDDHMGSPGLIVDPVANNTGLNPDDVQTLVDFNDNACADYPPSRDEKDHEGNCNVPGVPPPSDPGL